MIININEMGVPTIQSIRSIVIKVIKLRIDFLYWLFHILIIKIIIANSILIIFFIGLRCCTILIKKMYIILKLFCKQRNIINLFWDINIIHVLTNNVVKIKLKP